MLKEFTILLLHPVTLLGFWHKVLPDYLPTLNEVLENKQKSRFWRELKTWKTEPLTSAFCMWGEGGAMGRGQSTVAVTCHLFGQENQRQSPKSGK